MILRKSRLTAIYGENDIFYQNEYIVKDTLFPRTHITYFRHPIRNRCKFNLGTHTIYAYVIKDSSF